MSTQQIHAPGHKHRAFFKKALSDLVASVSQKLTIGPCPVLSHAAQGERIFVVKIIWHSSTSVEWLKCLAVALLHYH